MGASSTSLPSSPTASMALPEPWGPVWLTLPPREASSASPSSSARTSAVPESPSTPSPRASSSRPRAGFATRSNPWVRKTEPPPPPPSPWADPEPDTRLPQPLPTSSPRRPHSPPARCCTSTAPHPDHHPPIETRIPVTHPQLVMLPALGADSRLWQPVIDELGAEFDC